MSEKRLDYTRKEASEMAKGKRPKKSTEFATSGPSIGQRLLHELHESVGYCGRCGRRSCEGRKTYSELPAKIGTAHVLAAIETVTGESL